LTEQTRFFLYLLLSGGFFALLGGVFGAVVGYITWRGGRAAGTVLGLAVARAFARLGDEPMPPTTQGTLAGGVDGGLFGLMVGTVLGLATGWRGGEWRVLGPIMLAGLGLVALALGTLALILAGGGTRAVLGLFVGGAIGAACGYGFGGLDGLFVGTLAGAAAGAVAGRAARR
jgi:hypothetical protein